MKKVFFGFAAISLIMLGTSCNNETVEVNSDLGNMLAFKAATGKQTLMRASEVTLTTLQDETLIVKSYREDGTHYKDYEIEFVVDDQAWDYGTPEYHPLTYSLYHYSVYPTSVAMDINVPTASLNYTVEEEISNQVDLMVASAITTPDIGEADLVYKHILTQVNFAIQGKENLIVEINDITLTNINKTGTYTFNPGGPGGWDTPTDPTDYIYSLEDGTKTVATTGFEDGNILYLGNGGGTNNSDKALMLLPQTLDANAQLTFNYALYNETMDNDFFDSDIVTVNLNGLGGVSEWEAGKRYLYKLIFNPVYLEFYVDVVENWVDDTENTINNDGVIDINTTDYE